MTRKKGEEQPHQENPGSQATQLAKEKMNHVAAAAKLERIAHTSGQSANKGPQQSTAKAQSGPSLDRKSQGQMSTVLKDTKMTGNRGTAKSVPHTSLVLQEEPTLKDILTTGNACKCSLNSLCEQIGGIK